MFYEIYDFNVFVHFNHIFADQLSLENNRLTDVKGCGQGVGQDFKEAVKWFRKAALQGDADAQFNLGLMYINGEGVPQDYVTAYAWHNIAAANGNTDAATRKNNVAKQLTPAQITQAQALSRTLSSQIQIH